MPKGSTFEADLLNLVLCGKAISSVASTAGPTGLWNALHTADPSSGSGQDQSEVALAGYARVLTTRSTVAFTVTGSGPATASPVSAITFPSLTSTSTGTATHWSIGLSSSAAGKILYSGTLTPTIAMSQGISPQVTTGSSVTEA